MSAVQVNSEKQNIVERKPSTSDSSSVLEQANAAEVEKGAPQEDVEETKEHSWTSYERLRPFILVGIALVILGWWISSIVLPATRHRWSVFQPNATLFDISISNICPSPGSCRLSGLGLSSCQWADYFCRRNSCEPLSAYSIDRSPRIIAFRFIPSSVVSKPIGAVWGPLVSKPFDRLPRPVKLGLGWLALLAIVFGSAFGFSPTQASSCSTWCTLCGSGVGISNACGAGNYVW